MLFAAVLQLAVVQHVRNTLVDCAAEGARYAALAGHTPADGEERTRMLIEQTLSAAYSGDVTVARTTLDGLDVVDVRVSSPLPVLGLIGPGGRLTVHGHALEENP
ncbi:pilus assembly protein [Cellulomonas sp. URHB0016]